MRTDSFQWIICQWQISTPESERRWRRSRLPNECTTSKKFYFCRRQNGAVRSRRGSPARTGGHLEGKKVGGKKTWKRMGEKKSAPYVENASQTDTESKMSPFLRVSSLARRSMISQRQRFSRPDCDTSSISRFRQQFCDSNIMDEETWNVIWKEIFSFFLKIYFQVF